MPLISIGTSVMAPIFRFRIKIRSVLMTDMEFLRFFVKQKDYSLCRPLLLHNKFLCICEGF